jgi:hypothetical protein
MFSYFSLLVETMVFDKIQVNFLIVGHTHSSIDQYFSILSKAIGDCEFIGSPMALEALFEKAHKAGKLANKPLIQRQLTAYYDVITALFPYVNKKIKVSLSLNLKYLFKMLNFFFLIKFFQVPHRFVITLFGGRAIMQYKMFSGDEEFLPRRPDGLIDSFAKMEELSVDFAPPKLLSVINGEDELLNNLNINNNTNSSSKLNKAQLDTLINIQQLMPHFEKLSISSNKQLEDRMNKEAESGYLTPQILTEIKHNAVNSFKVYQQNVMIKASNSDSGFIMWLTLCDGLPPLEELNPDLIDPELAILDLIEQEKKKKEKKLFKNNTFNKNINNLINNNKESDIEQNNSGVFEITESDIEDEDHDDCEIIEKSTIAESNNSIILVNEVN